MWHFMCHIFFDFKLLDFCCSLKTIKMKQMLSIVPDSFLEKLNEKQDQIINLLKTTESVTQNEFLTEKEARERW